MSNDTPRDPRERRRDTKKPGAGLPLRAAALLVVAACSGAVAAMAQPYIQGIPGASCVPDNSIPADYYLYDGSYLVNTGSGGWDFFIASCAVSELAPGLKPRELRVFLTDPEESGVWWCQFFSWKNELVAEGFWTGPSGNVSIPLTVPLGWDFGSVEVTAHCVVPPGGRIERLEIIWEGR